MVRNRLILILIISFLVSGCTPIDYDEAGATYRDAWLAGLRQAAIAECQMQPDPAQCRQNLRDIVDAVIPPANQPDALRRAN